MHLTRRGRAVAGVFGAAVVTAVVLPVTLLTGGSGRAADHTTPAVASSRSAGRPAATGALSSPATASSLATTSDRAPATRAAPPAYSLTDPTSLWVVVNKRRPLQPIDYAPDDLAPVGDGQYMQQPAAGALLAMFAGAATAGHSVHADSGYRSYSYQVSVHGSAVARLGAEAADIGSARPGYSEHQTGWAVDVGGDGCEIATCFGATPDGEWVAANAYRYGFIVRYPAGEQAITGYEYEPWHLRYVGTQLAGEMHARGITTLEQWFDLPAAPSY
jgi:D-alanyl-D-alanine carboxypeptidase